MPNPTDGTAIPTAPGTEPVDPGFLDRKQAQVAGIAPEAAPHYQRIADKFGIGFDEVASQPKEVWSPTLNPDVPVEKSAWSRLAETDPVLAEHLKDSATATAAQDHIDSMSMWERWFAGISKTHTIFANNRAIQWNNVDVAALSYAQWMNGGALPPDQEARLKELQGDSEKRSAALEKEGEIGKVTYFFGEAAPTYVTSIAFLDDPQNLNTIGTAMGVGAAAGAATTAPTGPGMAAGAVAGAAKMGGATAAALGVLSAGKMELGLMYREARDEGLSHEQAKVPAMVVGVLNGSLELIPLNKVLKVFPWMGGAIKSGVYRDLVRKVIHSPNGAAVLARAAARIAEGAVWEGITEVLQEADTIVALESARGSNLWDSTRSLGTDRNLERLKEAGIAGAAGSLALGGPSIVMATAADVAESRRVSARLPFWTALGQLSRDTKLTERLPEKSAAYIEALQKKYDGPPEVSVPADKVRRLFQENGLAPEDVQRLMPDVAAQLEAAWEAAEGAPVSAPEVTIKLADIANHVAKLKGFEQLALDIRVGKNERTARESQDHQKRVKEIQAEAAALEASPDPVKPEYIPPTQRVYNDVYVKLKNSGSTEVEAKTDAAVWAAMMETRAARGLAPDAWEYYKKQIVDISTEGLEDVGASSFTAQMAAEFKDSPQGELIPEGRSAKVQRAARLSLGEHFRGYRVMSPDEYAALDKGTHVPAGNYYLTANEARAEAARTGGVSFPVSLHPEDIGDVSGTQVSARGVSRDNVRGAATTLSQESKAAGDAIIAALDESAEVAIPVTLFQIERNIERGADGQVTSATKKGKTGFDEYLAKLRAWMEAQKDEETGEPAYTKEDIDGQLKAALGQLKIFSALGPVELTMLPVGAGLAPGPAKVREGGTNAPGGPIRTNVDPIYKITFDASAMCVKRLEASATQAYIQSRLKDKRPLTASEKLALVALFKEAGKVAPCLYCYVESPRAKAGEFAANALSVVTGEVEIPAKYKEKARVAAEKARAQFKEMGLTRADLDPNILTDPKVRASTAGQIETVKKDAIYAFLEQQLLYAKANAPKLYEEYQGQILDLPQSLIDELNSYAGFRFFSTSDFQAEHIIDLVQAFNDLSVRKARAHSYTKVLEFAEIFGATGMKIQTSVFAKEVKNADGTVSFVEDTFQGMAWADAQRLGEKFENVGAVFVATSDAQVAWALDQKWVHYIIPFHYSGLESKYYQEMGWEDFTSTQSEKAVKGLVVERADGKFDAVFYGKPVGGPYPSKTAADVARRAHGASIRARVKEARAAAAARGEVAPAPPVEVEPAVDGSGFLALVGGEAIQKKGEDKVFKTEEAAREAGEKAAAGKPRKIRMHELGAEGGISDKEMTRNYLKLAEERGLEPVFSAFAGHPEYAKLKKDYARSDSAFKAINSKKIDMKAVGAALETIWDGTAPREKIDYAIGDTLIRLIEEGGEELGVIALRALEAKQSIERAAAEARENSKLKTLNQDEDGKVLQFRPPPKESRTKAKLKKGPKADVIEISPMSMADEQSGGLRPMTEEERAHIAELLSALPDLVPEKDLPQPPKTPRTMKEAVRLMEEAEARSNRLRGRVRAMPDNGPEHMYKMAEPLYKAWHAAEADVGRYASMAQKLGWSGSLPEISGDARPTLYVSVATTAEGEIWVGVNEEAKKGTAPKGSPIRISAHLNSRAAFAVKQTPEMQINSIATDITRRIEETNDLPPGMLSNLQYKEWIAGAMMAAVRSKQSELWKLKAKSTDPSKPRGYITFDDTRGWFSITKTGRSNLSTFLHESGHAFLEMLRRDAAQGDIGSMADLAAVEKWLGANPGAEFTVEQLEQFARGFEAYLFEGKTPSKKLESTFQRVSAWMRQVYKHFDNLGVNLDDDIRGVFDRLLASDEEIANARAAAAVQPSIDDATLTKMGYSPEQIADYKAVLTEASAEQAAEMEREVLRELRRQSTEEFEKITAEVKAEVEKDPTQNAWAFLTTGKLLDGTDLSGASEALTGKLDRAKVEALGLPKSVLKRLAPALQEGGLDPSTVAPYFRFQTGASLVDALVGLKRLDRAVRQEAARRMEEKYPGFKGNRAWLQEKAAEVMAGKQSEAVLRAELDLAYTAAQESERAVEAATDAVKSAQAEDKRKEAKGARTVAKGIAREEADALKTAAEARVGNMSPMHLRAENFARAARVAQAEVVKYMAAKDFTSAFAAKRRHLYNFFAWRAAVKAVAESKKIRDYLDSFDDIRVRRRLGKGGMNFVEAMDNLRASIDLENVSLQKIQKVEALRLFVEEMARQGTPTLNAAQMAVLATRNWKEMTIEELRAVHVAAKTIEVTARHERMIRIGMEEVDFKQRTAALAAHIEANTGKLPESKRQNESWRDLRWLKSAKAQLKKIEFICREMDGGAVAGFVHKNLFQPLADAQAKRAEMTKAITERLMDPFKTLTKEERKHLSSKVDFLGYEMTLADVIAIALNLGNEGNARKLIAGYSHRGWTYGAVMDRVDELLTKKDWEIASHIWKTVDELWPEMSALTQRQFGLPPNKVEGRIIKTRHGDIQGGYYPLVYDRRLSHKAEQIAQMKGDLWQNNFSLPIVAHGFTESRTEFAAPILLSLDVIPGHINEVIHYVTHYEAIRAVDRLTSNADVRAAITEGLGQEIYQQFRPWLQAIAQDGAPDPNLTYIGKALRHLRFGSSIALLGGKLTTGLIQGLGLASSWKEIKTKHMRAGLQRFLKGGWKKASELSSEIRNLDSQHDRDMAQMFQAQMNRFSKYGNASASIARFSLSWMMTMQKAVNAITWYAAREQAMAEGHGNPVAYADSIVRMTQSGGGIKDVAAVQRGGEGERMFVVMYTYFSVLYNQLAMRSGKTTTAGKTADYAARWWFLVLLPVTVEALARGRAPDPEDDTEDYLAAWAMEYFRYASRTIPFASTLTAAVTEEREPGYGPWMDTLIQGLATTKKIPGDRELSESDLRRFANSAGVVFHLPTGGLWNAWKYLDKYTDGDLEEPIMDLLFRSPQNWE